MERFKRFWCLWPQKSMRPVCPVLAIFINGSLAVGKVSVQRIDIEEASPSRSTTDPLILPTVVPAAPRPAYSI